MDGLVVTTNKVWKGMVAYREQYMLEAIAKGVPLVCTVTSEVDVMTVPNGLIMERKLHYSKPVYRDARTNRYDQRLVYFWWWPDGKQAEPKTDPNLPKQQTLM